MLVIGGKADAEAFSVSQMVNAQNHDTVHLPEQEAETQPTDGELPDEFVKFKENALSKIKPKELSPEIAQKIDAILTERMTAPSRISVEIKEKISPRELNNRKRLLEWVKTEEAAYIVGITIHIGAGVSDIRLQWEGLGIEEELVKALTDSGSKNSIPVFQFLKEVQSRLSRIRDSVYKESGAFKVEDVWLVPESKFPIYEEARQEKLMNYLQHELKFVGLMYEIGLRDYLERVALIIDSRKHLLDDDKIETLLQYYNGCFPSLEQVQSNLNVSCVPSIRIPGMAERVDRNAALQEAVAKEQEALLKVREIKERQDIQDEKLRIERENALRQAKLDREKLEAEESAYQEWRNNFAKTVQNTIDWANVQVLEIIDGALKQMKLALENDNSPALRDAVRLKLNEASTYLVEVANTNIDSLQSLVTQVKQVSQELSYVDSSAKQAELQQEIQELRDQVQSEFSIISTGAAGHHQRHIDFMEF